MDIGLVDDDITDVDPDTEDDAPALRHPLIPGHHAVLDGNSAGDRIHDAGELDENAIPGCLHDATVVCGDSGIGKFSPDGLKRPQGSNFVHAHEPAVANHV